MAVRAELKAEALAAKEKAQLFYFIYWKEEKTVSIHSDSEIINTEKNIGDLCNVQFKKNVYEGRIASKGTKNEMIALEKQYLQGTYTPFESAPVLSTAASPAAKDTEGKKRRKRKLVTDNSAKDEQKKSVKESTTVKTKRNTKKGTTKSPTKKKKKKKGSILVAGSGAESCSDSDPGVLESNISTTCSGIQPAKTGKTEDYLKRDVSRCSRGETTPTDSGVKILTGKETEVTSIGDFLKTGSEDSIAWEENLNSNNLYDFEKRFIPPPELSLSDELSNIHSELCLLRYQVDCLKYNTENRIYKLETTMGWLLGRQASDVPASFTPVSLQDTRSKRVSSTDALSTSSTSEISALSSRSSTPKPAPQELVDITNATVNSPPTSSSTSTVKPSQLLKKLIEKKEANPLPTIDRSKLLPPEDVVNKYSQFLYRSKLPTLAVKLCKESFFGKNVMSLCTVKGTGQHHALPETGMKALKLFMIELCVPRHTPTRLEFESSWKSCIEAIGQACKALRSSNQVTK